MDCSTQLLKGTDALLIITETHLDMYQVLSNYAMNTGINVNEHEGRGNFEIQLLTRKKKNKVPTHSFVVSQNAMGNLVTLIHLGSGSWVTAVTQLAILLLGGLQNFGLQIPLGVTSSAELWEFGR